MPGDETRSGTDGGANGQAGTEEIERLLREGAELLSAGKGSEAFDRAREVLRLRPSDPLASNLLGLALLEQGRHTEARGVFEGLTRQNPDVVPLRVNAGLAALGEGDLDGALDQFRRAIDLDPAHGRAFGYLAVVHLRLGEAGFARAALREAGLEALADQIGDGDPDAVLSALEAGVRALPAALSAAAPHEGFAESGAIPTAALDPSGSSDAGEAEEAAEALDDALDLALGEAQQLLRHRAPTRELPEVTRKTFIPRGNLPATEPRARALTLVNAAAEVELQEPTVAVRLNTSATQDGVVVREDHVVLQRGELVWQEVERRRKGKRSGPFQVDEARMMQVEGEGLVVLHGGPGRLHLFRLEESGLYLREQDIVAFADRLYWENGRIPQAGDEGPAMVNLRGSGFAAARLQGELWNVRTRRSELTTVRLDHLLGWSPDAVPVAVTPAGRHLLVGFRGAGVVWLDLPAGGGPSDR